MLKKTAKQLVEEAMTEVTTYTVEQARALHGHPGVQFVAVAAALPAEPAVIGASEMHRRAGGFELLGQGQPDAEVQLALGELAGHAPGAAGVAAAVPLPAVPGVHDDDGPGHDRSCGREAGETGCHEVPPWTEGGPLLGAVDFRPHLVEDLLAQVHRAFVQKGVDELIWIAGCVRIPWRGHAERSCGGSCVRASASRLARSAEVA